MPRKGHASLKREVLPDPVYQSTLVTKFVNSMMYDGKKSTAEDIFYASMKRMEEKGGDEALSVALAPTIETALRESVRKDPATLADALFPVMGPAIRRSILETLRSFLESFNQVLDQSLSVKGLKWRLEALRTAEKSGWL